MSAKVSAHTVRRYSSLGLCRSSANSSFWSGRVGQSRARHNFARAQPQPSQDDAQGSNKLSFTIKRKQQQVAHRLEELGNEMLDDRLQSATESPERPDAYKLAKLIQEYIPQGKAVIVLELSRSATGAESAEELARIAKACVGVGADALAIRIDADYTPEGIKDLFTVCRVVKIPVLAWDWFLHPLQVIEAKEAGAAGVVGTVTSVLSKGTPIMSSFAASIGMDCPVEIVNAAELREVSQYGVPFYGVGLSVGLNVSIPGFAASVTKGLLGDLPFGALSMVGARSLQEARDARLAGADAILVKRELLDQYQGRVQQLVEQLRYITSGDD